MTPLTAPSVQKRSSINRFVGGIGANTVESSPSIGTDEAKRGSGTPARGDPACWGGGFEGGGAAGRGDKRLKSINHQAGNSNIWPGRRSLSNLTARGEHQQIA